MGGGAWKASRHRLVRPLCHMNDAALAARFVVIANRPKERYGTLHLHFLAHDMHARVSDSADQMTADEQAGN